MNEQSVEGILAEKWGLLERFGEPRLAIAVVAAAIDFADATCGAEDVHDTLDHMKTVLEEMHIDPVSSDVPAQDLSFYLQVKLPKILADARERMHEQADPVVCDMYDGDDHAMLHMY